MINNTVKAYPVEIVWPSPDDNDDTIDCVKVKYVSLSVFDKADTIMLRADMSSNNLENKDHLFFYDTLNELVLEGGRNEEINQHDLAILKDLVSSYAGTEDDEVGTKKYPEIYMFSDHVTTTEGK